MQVEKFLNNLYLFRQNFKNYLLDLFDVLYVKIYLAAMILVNILIWVLSKFITSRIGAEQMALHYNVDFGIDYYGNVANIYIIPILGFFIILVNFFLFAFTAKYKDKIFISHLLFSSAILSNVILLAAVISIYLVNFR